ncbi:hypothetical protein BGZ76_011498 [Entomortierella beljakovae]|nr:hypothetical protein BGZ76_011498 [Entomortierella beljakovae]
MFQRKLASHIFNVKAFRVYIRDVFVVEGLRVVDHLLKTADEGTFVDLHEQFLKFTLDGSELRRLTAACSDRSMDPSWKIRERLTSVGGKVAYDRKHARSLIEKRHCKGYQYERKDLIQLFLDTKDDQGNPLSEDFIANIILLIRLENESCEGSNQQGTKDQVDEVDNVLQGQTPTNETYKQLKFAKASVM